MNYLVDQGRIDLRLRDWKGSFLVARRQILVIFQNYFKDKYMYVYVKLIRIQRIMTKSQLPA